MIIIALADIHGSCNFFSDIAPDLAKADLVVIAGDITNFGDIGEAEKIIGEPIFESDGDGGSDKAEDTAAKGEEAQVEPGVFFCGDEFQQQKRGEGHEKGEVDVDVGIVGDGGKATAYHH